MFFICSPLRQTGRGSCGLCGSASWSGSARTSSRRGFRPVSGVVPRGPGVSVSRWSSPFWGPWWLFGVFFLGDEIRKPSFYRDYFVYHDIKDPWIPKILWDEWLDDLQFGWWMGSGYFWIGEYEFNSLNLRWLSAIFPKSGGEFSMRLRIWKTSRRMKQHTEIMWEMRNPNGHPRPTTPKNGCCCFCISRFCRHKSAAQETVGFIPWEVGKRCDFCVARPSPRPIVRL